MPAPKPKRRAPAKPSRSAGASPAVASDTPEGKAFAEVQTLFPGRVLEVVALRPGRGEEAAPTASEGTDDAFTAGYDVRDEQDGPGDDA
ncbi:MAG: hypothetical protein ROY82_07715 [Truepera sp.]|nr:hypothetical protein [Truepera sp.]